MFLTHKDTPSFTFQNLAYIYSNVILLSLFFQVSDRHTHGGLWYRCSIKQNHGNILTNSRKFVILRGCGLQSNETFEIEYS